MTNTEYIMPYQTDLSGFHSEAKRYEVPTFKNLVYTEGVQHVMTRCRIAWFINEVAILLPSMIKTHPNELYTVILGKRCTGNSYLAFTDGKEESRILFLQSCGSVKFRLSSFGQRRKMAKEMEFLLKQEQTKDGCIRYCLMLPSEH